MNPTKFIFEFLFFKLSDTNSPFSNMPLPSKSWFLFWSKSTKKCMDLFSWLHMLNCKNTHFSVNVKFFWTVQITWHLIFVTLFRWRTSKKNIKIIYQVNLLGVLETIEQKVLQSSYPFSKSLLVASKINLETQLSLFSSRSFFFFFKKKTRFQIRELAIYVFLFFQNNKFS